MHSLDSHIALVQATLPRQEGIGATPLSGSAGHLIGSTDCGLATVHAGNHEPMPSVRTLTPLFALGISIAGCRAVEPTTVLLKAELRGAAHIDSTGLQVFDARRPPVLAMTSTQPIKPTVHFDDLALASTLTRRGQLTVVRAAAPARATAGELCLVTERARQCWRTRFDPNPLREPAMQALDKLNIEMLPTAVSRLMSSERIWGHQIYARRLAGAGDAAAASKEWSAAAEAAVQVNYPREAARSLRSGSFMATSAAAYADAERFLDRAMLVLGSAATEDDRLLDQYYRAFVEHSLSRYRQATARLTQVAETAWATGHDNTFGFALDFLGVVLVDQGRIAEAKVAIHDERLAAQANRRAPSEKAVFLNNRSWITLMAVSAGVEHPRMLIEAMDDLEAALQLTNRSRGRRSMHSNLAWGHLLRGNVQQARALVDKIPSTANDPDAELMRGEIALRQQRLDDAAAAFGRASTTLARTAAGLPTDNTWRAAYGLGRIAAARGDRTAALAHYRAALDALDAVGARAGVWHARARFYADRRPLIDDTVRLLLEAGADAEAFGVVDRANARALRALEARTRLDRLPAAVRSEWEQHRARFAAARQAWDAARDEGELLGPAQKATWQADQATRQKEMVTAFEAAEALLTREAPRRVAAADAAAIAAALPAGSALLAFGRIGDAVHGFRLAPGRPVEHRRIGAEPTAAQLIEAFGDTLPGVTHLYVVPGDVPAARELATVSHDGAPLGTRMSLSDLAYAGLVLRPHGVASRPVLVVADPTVDLPHAHDEGRAVAARLPGAHVLARSAATLTAVRAAMAGARALHYAGHGVARAESPWQAHLALAGETTLTVADILTADVPAGTVVLSGCRTGVRSALSTREALGLADAFVAAGSRAVLATRRNIPDEAAARFIARFHAEGGLDRPGAALMAATAAFHRAGDPIWSAFRLTGHP